MNALRSTLFSLGYFLSGIFYGTISLLSWLLPPLSRHRFVIGWTYFSVAWLRFCCGIRYEVHGRDNIKNIERPIIILSKHQSTWETLFLQGLLFPAVTVLKKELLNIPFFGWGLRALLPIAIDRTNPREALRTVKQKGLKRLQQGYNLVLFPEGTRSVPGKKHKYARSGADIAVQAGVPVIPVAVNSGRFWQKGKFVKVPGTIQVHIGEAISPEGKDSRQLIQEVEDWIENKMQDL